MELFVVIALLAILVETSYVTYHTTRKATTSKGDILLDTSVLIDGRILAIARSGLMSSRLIVARSVVRELQFMADKADHDKRERARYGLDVIEKLRVTSQSLIAVLAHVIEYLSYGFGFPGRVKNRSGKHVLPIFFLRITNNFHNRCLLDHLIDRYH